MFTGEKEREREWEKKKHMGERQQDFREAMNTALGKRATEKMQAFCPDLKQYSIKQAFHSNLPKASE